MGHFLVTFRFGAGATYSDRYKSFVDKIEEISEYVWDETSSFYAIKASGTAESICDLLYFDTQFSPSKDMMVVIDLDRKEKSTRGELLYPDTLDTCIGF